MPSAIRICGNFQRVSNAFTHATVAGTEEWLSLLVIGLRMGWSAALLDISQAFLQTSEEFSRVGNARAFLNPPLGIDAPPGHVFEVLRSIRGWRTAQSQWQRTLAACLKKKGFKSATYSDCIFTGKVNGQEVIVITYVDDCGRDLCGASCCSAAGGKDVLCAS